MLNITIFNGKGKYKVPMSPYTEENKNKFLFKTIQVPFNDLLIYNENDFILTSSFNIDGKLLGRNSFSLTPFLTEEFNFLIIDFDKIYSKFNAKNIISALKKKDYKFSIYASRSNNGIDVFNLKGVIKFRGKNNTTSRLKAYEYLHTLVGEYCKVDMSISSTTSYQSPTFQNKLVYNWNGTNTEEFFFEDDITYKPLELVTNKSLEMDVYNLCTSIYFERGFTVYKEDDKIVTLRHPKEKTKGGYFFFKDTPTFLCHFNKEKSFSIYDDIKNHPVYKKYQQSKIESVIEDKIFIPFKTRKINERYINVDSFKEELQRIQNNEDYALIIKSAMGTGKTNIIKEVQNKRVLLLTNRRTLAYEYKSKFPEMILYCEDEYSTSDSLICQYDSIHKYNLQHFDVIILDEFMSLLLHSLSALTVSSNFNKLKIFYILNKLKTPLIIMDAFLTGLELQFLKRNKIEKVENIYRDDINVNFHSNEHSQLKKLVNVLGEGKVTFSCTNKMYGRVIKKITEQLGYNVKMIDSETSDEQRELIFEMMKKDKHDGWDLLIYTPTITVGVNILNESKYHFHYSDGTTDIISSIQQTKRNRVASEVHILLKNKRYQNIINLEEIHTISRQKLKEYNVIEGLYVDFDEWGNYNLSEFGEFNNKIIYMDNILKTNHNFIFKFLCKEQFNISLFKEIEETPMEFDITQIKREIKQEDKDTYTKEIEELFEMNDFDFEINKSDSYKLIEETFNCTKEEVKTVLNFIQKDKKFISKIKMLNLYFSDRVNTLIKFGISENFKSSYIQNLEIIHKFQGITLKDKYLEPELRSEKFRKVLRLIGYKRRGKSYRIDPIYKQFMGKMIEK